jgi:putative transposase
MSAVLELGKGVGQSAACRALGVPRATLYRRLQPPAPPGFRPTPGRALDAAERQVVLDHLHAERFCDKAPVEVYATLIDEGTYLCSIPHHAPHPGPKRRAEGAPQPTPSSAV